MTTESQHQPSSEVVELVQHMLDHEASANDVARLEAILHRDPAARRYFLKMRMLHAALEREFQTGIEPYSTEDRVIPFPIQNAPVTVTDADEAGLERWRGSWKWARWAVAAVGMILASLAVFWGGDRIFNHAAYQIVARDRAAAASVPAIGTVLKSGDRLTVAQGTVELRTAKGATLTLEGPGNLRIDDYTLALAFGKLWAAVQGRPIVVNTPNGRITDLGTTFAIDQTAQGTTRLDVFEGRVRFSDPANSGHRITAGAGRALFLEGSKWPPGMREADASRYAAGRRPIGLSFVGNSRDAALIGSQNPFNIRWTTVSSPAGEVQLTGASFKIAWAGSSFYSAGASQSPEAAVFHTHLMGYPWNGPHAERNSEAVALGLPTGPYGIVIQLRDMAAWLGRIGATSYRVSLLRNSQVPGVDFFPVTAHAGQPGEKDPIAVHKPKGRGLLAANFPDASGGIGARAFESFDGSFTEDTLTLTLPIQAVGVASKHRPNVAALFVTPVF